MAYNVYIEIEIVSVKSGFITHINENSRFLFGQLLMNQLKIDYNYTRVLAESVAKIDVNIYNLTKTKINENDVITIKAGYRDELTQFVFTGLAVSVQDSNLRGQDKVTSFSILESGDNLLKPLTINSVFTQRNLQDQDITSQIIANTGINIASIMPDFGGDDVDEYNKNDTIKNHLDFIVKDTDYTYTVQSNVLKDRKSVV